MSPWQRPITHEPPLVPPPEKAPPVKPELPPTPDPAVPIPDDDPTAADGEGSE